MGTRQYHIRERGMIELYLIRHGLAGKSLEDEAKDEARPLKKKGKEVMKDVAKALKKLDVCFDAILTSPLLRSKQSAEIIHAYCGNAKKVTETGLLKPAASFSNLIKLLNKFKGSKKIALVGHEPFLSSFASYCLSNDKNSFINLKKSGIIKLEVDEVVKPGRCFLSWLIEPIHVAL